MAISAAMVRDLREHTGLPMMECKKALEESNGDIEQAVAWLKKHASAKLTKMASRETSQGRVAVHISEDRTQAGAIELLCETAPVANTDDFIHLAGQAAAATAALSEPTAESVLAAPAPGDPAKTINDLKEDAFSRLRENMMLKRVAAVRGHVAGYLHHNGQVGVIVAFSEPCPPELGADVCMHIAAMNPPYLKREQVDPVAVAEERERATGEAQGKPPEIIEKIVTGKLDRWYSEIVLLEQPFVKDDKKSVQQALSEAAAGLTITECYRLQVGA